MTPHTVAFPPGYLIGGIIFLLILVMLLIAGIIVAVRAKPGVVRACAITTAAACSVLSCLALIALVGGALLSSSQTSAEAQDRPTPVPEATANRTLDERVIQAKNNSCQISVPKAWLDALELNKDAVIGAKDPTENEFAMVITDTKEQYHGSLSDYARDTTNRMRGKLTSPQMEPAEPITINGQTAIRQILRGEYDQLQIVYVITYFESENRLYQLICWSLESNAASAKPDFEKITQSFQAVSASE